MSGSFIRFVAAGLLNTGFTYLLFLVLCRWMRPQLAYTATYVLGIALSYILNVRFVFRTGLSIGSAMRFPLVYVAQYLYGLAALTVLVSTLRLPNAAGMALVVVTSVPLTFMLSRMAIGAPGWR